MKLLKDLVLALINATLLLLIGLVVAGLLLIGRVGDLAETVTGAIAPQAAQLQRIADGVDAIDARLETVGDGAEIVALKAEIAGLRADVAEASNRLDAVGDITAETLVARLRAALTKLAAS